MRKHRNVCRKATIKACVDFGMGGPKGTDYYNAHFAGTGTTTQSETPPTTPTFVPDTSEGDAIWDPNNHSGSDDDIYG